MRTLGRGFRDDGAALLEVLIGGVVLSIALTGMALMFGLGRAAVLAVGDDRVALHLAEEKPEQLRALGFAAIPKGATTETINAGVADAQLFTRTTCVIYVNNTSLTPVSGNAFSPCTVGTPTSTIAIRVTVTSVLPQSIGATLDAVVINPPS